MSLVEFSHFQFTRNIDKNLCDMVTAIDEPGAVLSLVINKECPQKLV